MQYLITENGLTPVSNNMTFHTGEHYYVKFGARDQFYLITILQAGNPIQIDHVPHSRFHKPSVQPQSILSHFITNGTAIATRAAVELEQANLPAAAFLRSVLNNKTLLPRAIPSATGKMPVTRIEIDAYAAPNSPTCTATTFQEAENFLRTAAATLNENHTAETDVTLHWDVDFTYSIQLDLHKDDQNADHPLTDAILDSWQYGSGDRIPTHTALYVTEYIRETASERPFYQQLLQTYALQDILS